MASFLNARQEIPLKDHNRKCQGMNKKQFAAMVYKPWHAEPLSGHLGYFCARFTGMDRWEPKQVQSLHLQSSHTIKLRVFDHKRKRRWRQIQGKFSRCAFLPPVHNNYSAMSFFKDAVPLQEPYPRTRDLFRNTFPSQEPVSKFSCKVACCSLCTSAPCLVCWTL